MTQSLTLSPLSVVLNDIISDSVLTQASSRARLDLYLSICQDQSRSIPTRDFLSILEDLCIIAVAQPSIRRNFFSGFFRSPVLLIDQDSSAGLLLQPHQLKDYTIDLRLNPTVISYVLFTRLPQRPITKFHFAWLQFYPQWKSYILTLFFLLIGSIISVLPIIAIEPIFDTVVPRAQLPSLLLIGAALILAQLFGSFSSTVASIFSTLFEQDIRFRSYIALVDRFLLARPLGLPKREAGLWSQTFKTALAFTSSIRTIVVGIPLALFTIVLNCVVFGVALAQPWVIFLLIFLCMIPAFINILFGWRVGKIGFGLVSINSRIDQHLFTSFRTIGDARSLGISNLFTNQFHNLREELNVITLRMNAWNEAGLFINSFLGSLLVAVILFLYSASHGISQGGYLVIFVAFSSVSSGFTQLAESLSQILASAPTYFSKNALRDIDQYCSYRLYTETTTQTDSPDENVSLVIQLKKLSFCYDRQEPLLHDINISFSSPNSYAITGSPGSGKSTLLKIIGGLYSPLEGVVLINGIPNTATVNELDKFHVMYIPQIGKLLGSTIREFIDPFQLKTDDQILNAISQVGLSPLMGGLHMGLQTVISELSSDLSSGQVQLFQAARAVLHKPVLLLSDEPTSFLPESQHLETLNLLNTHSTLHISTLHRLSASSLFSQTLDLH